MEEKEDVKETKNGNKGKVIDYIDDSGNIRRVYTSSTEVEEYIKQTYEMVNVKKLTQENFCDII